MLRKGNIDKILSLSMLQYCVLL